MTTSNPTPGDASAKAGPSGDWRPTFGMSRRDEQLAQNLVNILWDNDRRSASRGASLVERRKSAKMTPSFERGESDTSHAHPRGVGPGSPLPTPSDNDGYVKLDAQRATDGVRRVPGE